MGHLNELDCALYYDVNTRLGVRRNERYVQWLCAWVSIVLVSFVLVLVLLNLTQANIFWEEETSTEKILPSDWSMSVGQFLFIKKR